MHTVAPRQDLVVQLRGLGLHRQVKALKLSVLFAHKQQPRWQLGQLGPVVGLLAGPHHHQAHRQAKGLLAESLGPYPRLDRRRQGPLAGKERQLLPVIHKFD